jgi:hypothetical protein
MCSLRVWFSRMPCLVAIVKNAASGQECGVIQKADADNRFEVNVTSDSQTRKYHGDTQLDFGTLYSASLALCVWLTCYCLQQQTTNIALSYRLWAALSPSK